MAYTNDELTKIVDSLRVRLDQLKFGDNGPPPDLNAPRADEVPAEATYSGPGYPRITVVREGVRRIQFNKDTGINLKERHLPQMGGGHRPEIYPGVSTSDGRTRFYFDPGAVVEILTDRLNDLSDSDSLGIKDPNVQFVYLPRLTPFAVEEEEEEVRGTFSGAAAFYFHPDDMDRPVTDRRASQGPVPGDPDYGVVETAPTGAGLSDGYRSGTQGNPYRPWDDPNSDFYGWPVKGS